MSGCFSVRPHSRRFYYHNSSYGKSSSNPPRRGLFITCFGVTEFKLERFPAPFGSAILFELLRSEIRPAADGKTHVTADESISVFGGIISLYSGPRTRARMKRHSFWYIGARRMRYITIFTKFISRQQKFIV